MGFYPRCDDGLCGVVWHFGGPQAVLQAGTYSDIILPVSGHSLSASPARHFPQARPMSEYAAT
ncbi:hypothetical protein [Roseibium limicola]|uniref:Uncharacterized protein n=1 Tax=Roseibium limicola TaxID=2816037 RepID=A0A939J449_9HYPH|nr:hypothetical protein [Roseibium limicola]MBO0344375.1 hypothetical protein [Roseibium limicola]